MEKSHSIRITALTPVHVGAGQEKKLLYGVDYFYDERENMVIIVDQARAYSLLPPGEQQKYLNYLAAGKPDKFFETNKTLRETIINKAAIAKIKSPSGSPGTEDIFPLISTHGQNGRQVYIPGSSIKGALRSVIYAWLKNKYNVKDEKEAFGEITNNLMSFIHVTDAFFNDSRIARTKLYNIALKGGEWTAAWAVARRQTSLQFTPESFSTLLEAISADAASEFTIRINYPRLTFLKKHNAGLNLKHRDFLENLTIKKLFEIVNWHTQRYLKAELEFFEHYNNGEEYNAEITGSFNKLIKNVPESGTSCLLHMGYGSGFHGITGDWQYPGDHIHTGGRTPKYRTRRLFYRKIKVRDKTEGFNSKREFLPLGFVRLDLLNAG